MEEVEQICTGFSRQRRFSPEKEMEKNLWKRWVKEWLEIFPGTDGRVRVAKIEVGNTTLRRPITRLYPLEFK